MKAILRILAVAIVVILLDRLTKIWVVDWLNLRNLYRIDVLPPYFNLRMAWNEGINFGLFGGGPESRRWLLIGVALGIVVAILVWMRHARRWPLIVSAGLLVGGAIGNVWDRIVWGAVADFVNMSCCGINNPFAFNLADATIFLGVAGILIWDRRTR